MLELGDFVMTNIAYGLYLCVSIGMTIWVARVLSESGEVFLIKCFGQDKELAQSTNRLLVIGFYLVNIGFITTRLGGWKADTVDLIPDVGSRIGLAVLILGAMHFFNMFMLAKFGRTVNGWLSANELAKSASTDMSVEPELPPRTGGNGTGNGHAGTGR
jgi:hypothetical protein